MDRLERLMELLIDDRVKFQEEHKLLLTAQVVLTDRVDRLTKDVTELTTAQRYTDERLNALITIVDGSIRNRPQP